MNLTKTLRGNDFKSIYMGRRWITKKVIIFLKFNLPIGVYRLIPFYTGEKFGQQGAWQHKRGKQKVQNHKVIKL